MEISVKDLDVKKMQKKKYKVEMRLVREAFKIPGNVQMSTEITVVKWSI